MYNDYYGQAIYNRLGTTNENLEDIITNQEEIIKQQQQLISGDNIIIKNTENTFTGVYVIALIACLLLIYNFVIRSMKT